MANTYDRVFKENVPSWERTLLKKFLGIDPAELVPIDAKMQLTLEREMDHIRKVVAFGTNPNFGVQIEFHTSNEDLRARNLVHYALFYQITGLPLKQLVIYAGVEKATKILLHSLEIDGIHYQFKVIVLAEYPKEEFLYGETPEEVIMALLCDYGGDSPEEVTKMILTRLKKMLKGKNQIRKFQKQLLILSRLRKMELIVKNQIEAMTFHYEVETDGLYLEGKEKGELIGLEKGLEQGIEKGIEQGLEQGIEQGKELKSIEMIQNMWDAQVLSFSTIASIAEVREEYVLEVIQGYLLEKGQTEAEVAEMIKNHSEKFL
jgi:predicted transposase YdaD